MSVNREDLQHMDVAAMIDAGGPLPPIHPGEILREEFLAPLGMSAHALAMALHVPAPRVHNIVREQRAITPDTALRLARYFSTTPEFWSSLQQNYNLRIAIREVGEKIAREVRPHADLS